MTNQEILQKLATKKKGCYISLTKRKELGSGIIKESDMNIRIGVAYANMSINEGKRTGHMTWGEWVPGLENLVVQHKGNYYLRISSKTPENPEGSTDVIATRYYRDGREISKQEVLDLIGAEKISASPVYNIKFENIKEIQ